MAFKDILKFLREENALTQKELASACDLSHQCISQLENGTRNPTGSTLLALADFFECSVDHLLDRKKDFNDFSYDNETYSTLSTKSREVLYIFDRLDDLQQSQILEYVRFFGTRNNIKYKKRSTL